MDPFCYKCYTFVFTILSCLCDTLLEKAFFVIFPNGVPGQVWYLVVSIPGLCLPF